jgi:hypothetical protein
MSNLSRLVAPDRGDGILQQQTLMSNASQQPEQLMQTQKANTQRRLSHGHQQ